MGKIYYIMGKSSSGKDTLFRKIKQELPMLQTVTLYTTRPKREGEREGVEYHFVTDEQVNLAESDYLMIGTLESYGKLKKYYGAAYLVPVYIEVEDGERLNRALTRERQQEVPRYAEMCRRFLADTEDFSEEHLRAAGIKKRYYNDDQKRCLDEIIEDIRYGKF